MQAKTFLMITSIAALLAAGNSQAAQETFRAFGVSRQTLPSSLNCTAIYSETPPDGTGQYVCEKLPGGIAGVEQYIIAYVAGLGICNITGVSPFIAEDPRGSKTRRIFKQILNNIDQEYGPPDQQVDQVADGGQSNDSTFQEDVITERRQIFDQWNSLASISADAESASLIISGSQELGLSVYTVVRFSGNDTCLEELGAATSSIGSE